MESALVWVPSVRRQFSDPGSHSTETRCLAGTVGTDGCLDWMVLRGRGWMQLRRRAVTAAAPDRLIYTIYDR